MMQATKHDPKASPSHHREARPAREQCREASSDIGTVDDGSFRMTSAMARR